MTSPQARIGSPFNAHSTAEEVIAAVDLSGQTAIVTGGYSGLGLEAARVLALAGARVIVPSRAPDRAAAALRSIGGVEVATLDLMSAASIDAFAERFINSGRPLNILLNSAAPSSSILKRYDEEHAALVNVDRDRLQALGLNTVERDLLAEDGVIRHCPDRLAKAVFEMAQL